MYPLEVPINPSSGAVTSFPFPVVSFLDGKHIVGIRAVTQSELTIIPTSLRYVLGFGGGSANNNDRRMTVTLQNTLGAQTHVKVPYLHFSQAYANFGDNFGFVFVDDYLDWAACTLETGSPTSFVSTLSESAYFQVYYLV